MPNRHRRLGVILPPGNVTMEIELPRYLPPGTSVHFNRLSRAHTPTSKQALLDMIASVPRTADDLAHISPDAVLYGCTSGSFVAGVDGDRALCAQLRDITGAPAVTTSSAVLEACHALGMKRLFMITPYPEEINEHEVEFLQAHGLVVTGYDSFRLSHTREYAAVPSAEVARMALANRAAIEAADGLFISCTQLPAMDQLQGLEDALSRPVICSNQASLWALLQRLDPPGDCARLPGRLSLCIPAHSRSETP